MCHITTNWKHKHTWEILTTQVDMKTVCIFIPKHHTGLAAPGPDIIDNYRQLAQSGLLGETGVVCLPRVTVQSAGLKTMATLQDLPITTVEGSLVGMN